MPRLPYPEDVSALDAKEDPIIGSLAPLNIFRMFCHAPHLLQPFVSLGTSLLLHGRLSPITRECVILRVGYLSGAGYETAQHEAIGRAIGMSDALIEAVKAGPSAPGLTVEESLALTFTDHLINHPRPSDETLQPTLAHFGPAGLQELVIIIGYYMMVCRYLETFGVDVEEGGARGAAIVMR